MFPKHIRVTEEIRRTLTHFSFTNIWHCQQQLREMTTITSSSADRNIKDLSPIGEHIDFNNWNKTKRFSKWVQREIKWKEKIHEGQEHMKDIRTQRIPTREHVSAKGKRRIQSQLSSINSMLIITENTFLPFLNSSNTLTMEVNYHRV